MRRETLGGAVPASWDLHPVRPCVYDGAGADPPGSGPVDMTCGYDGLGAL